MDYKAFSESNKAYLIAPAGYGKTYTIVECLKYTFGRQLILTHTHAGVTSIKEKIKNSSIPSSNYRVETISSFAQKYFRAFYTKSDIPEQKDSKTYHPFIITKAKDIFGIDLVKKVLKVTYQGLFVDEYQDCTKDQHSMIIQLADILPTRILGDPLQAIFDFNADEVVDFVTDLKEFERFSDLDTPYRWQNSNKFLGEKVKEFRKKLENKENLELRSDTKNGLEIILINNDYKKNISKIGKKIDELIKDGCNSLLVIVGNDAQSRNANERQNYMNKIDFTKSLELLEAIDGEDFYFVAEDADKLLSGNSEAIFKFLEKMFYKTDLKAWFSKTKLKNVNKQNKSPESEDIKNLVNNFLELKTPKNLQKILVSVKDTLKLNLKRKEIFYSLQKSLDLSDKKQLSVYEAMKENRNIIRRMGKKVTGKCMGTTLLTKGLEFDTVVILDADQFDCHKHLYVALTRACKKLIIFTKNIELSPKYN